MTFQDPPDKLQDKIYLKEVCAKCDKPISNESQRDRRSGSITSWIFNDQYRSMKERWVCSCAPSPVGEQAPISKVQQTPDNMIRPSAQGAGLKTSSVSERNSPLRKMPDVVHGKWRAVQFIGAGPLGAVYKAESVADLHAVSMKVLDPLVASNPRIVKRFLQECKKASELHDKNIATVYDYGTAPDGTVYAIYEHIDDSLKKLINEQGFFDVPDALRIFIEVCDALIVAHASGVIHRGIKPSNIMLQSDKTVRMVDFGVAKALPSEGREAAELTKTSYVFVDPYYLSPEGCKGESQDERSDIYSLGCVMYEVLTGKRPFHKLKGIQLAIAHLSKTPSQFSEVMFNCDIPSELESVVMTALEKNPNDRYQSAKDLKEDLILLRDGKRPRARAIKLKLAYPAKLSFANPLSWWKNLSLLRSEIPVLLVLFVLTIVPFLLLSAPMKIQPKPAQSQHAVSTLDERRLLDDFFVEIVPFKFERAAVSTKKSLLETLSKSGKNNGLRSKAHFDNLSQLAMAYVEDKQPSQAAEIILEQIELAPDIGLAAQVPVLQVQLAYLYIQEKRYSLAIKYVDQANSAFRTSAKPDPRYWCMGLLMAGDLSTKAVRSSNAADAYNKYFEIAEKLELQDTLQYREALLKSASLKLSGQYSDLKEGKEQILKAIDKDSKTSLPPKFLLRARYLLGMLQQRSLDYDDACTSFRNVQNVIQVYSASFAGEDTSQILQGAQQHIDECLYKLGR